MVAVRFGGDSLAVVSALVPRGRSGARPPGAKAAGILPPSLCTDLGFFVPQRSLLHMVPSVRAGKERQAGIGGPGSWSPEPSPGPGAERSRTNV